MPTNDCTRTCWVAGGVSGLIVLILTAGAGDMRWFEGLFLGLITAVLLALFLVWALCGGRATDADLTADRDRARASAAGFGAGPRPVYAGSPPPEANASTATPSAEPSRSVAAKPKAAEKSQDAAPRTGAASAMADAEAGSAPSGASVAPLAAKETATAAEPEKFSAPPAAQQSASDGPDNLKEIKGVGPKMERLLHDNGVTRFAQIAEWSDADIDRFADLIGSMGGRIRSDDWRAQAKTLAAGGETEFSRRVDKGDIY